MNPRLMMALLGTVASCGGCVMDHELERLDSAFAWGHENGGLGFADAWADGGESDGADHDGDSTPRGDDYLECEPECWDRPCGADDGCGATCGCPEGEECSYGSCVEVQLCPTTPQAGCCVGELLHTCDNGAVKVTSCSANGQPHCGWNPAEARYTCGTAGLEDPTGFDLRPCPGYCEPQCAGNECGSNGCGGTCGDCAAGETCEDALCVKQLGCPQGWGEPLVFPFNAAPSCYRLILDLNGAPLVASWHDAAEHCETLGAILATVHSYSENLHVSAQISAMKVKFGVWLGFHQSGTGAGPTDAWTWVDGIGSPFAGWAEFQPDDVDQDEDGDEDCGAMLNADGEGAFWIDRDCQSQLAFVCKMAAQDGQARPTGSAGSER